MKKHIAIALSLMMILILAGCGNKTTGNGSSVAGEADISNKSNVVDAEESQNAVSEAPENANIITNPMQKITDAELIKTYSRGLVLPDSVTNAEYYLYNDNLFEIRFKGDGVSYVARTAVSDSYEDISGMYYEWTIEENDGLAHLGLQGSTKRYISKEETVDVASWYDQENGVNYSLSAVAADLDGFDITAIVAKMIAG